MTPSPIVVDLPAIANRLLDMYAAEVDNPPVRRYRTIGLQPAWDKEQMTVALTPMTPGLAGAPAPNRPEETPNGLRIVQMVLECVRCVPADDPTADQLDAATIVHLNDYQAADTMVRKVGFSSKIKDEALVAAGVKGVAPGQVTSVSPSGGMAAVRVFVTIQV